MKESRGKVWVELLDGILMPVAVGFLYLLAISEVVPEPVRVICQTVLVLMCWFDPS